MAQLGVKNGDEALVDKVAGARGVEQQQLVRQGQVRHHEAHWGGKRRTVGTRNYIQCGTYAIQSFRKKI